MITSILVPLDGSARAERALPHVTRIASALNSRVGLIHAISGYGSRGIVDTFAYRAAQLERARYLDEWATQLRRAGLVVSTSIDQGGAAEVIVHRVHREAYDLVALTPHGTGSSTRLQAGCTALAVTVSVDASVLIVPDGGYESEPDRAGRAGCIVAAVDCSAESDAAIDVAAKIAVATDCRLELAHVLITPNLVGRRPPSKRATQLVADFVELSAAEARTSLADAVRGLKARGLSVAGHLIEGERCPADQLCRAIDSRRHGLAVIYSGRRGSFLRGSLATRIACHSRVPVLLVRDCRPELLFRSVPEHWAPGRAFPATGYSQRPRWYRDSRIALDGLMSRPREESFS